MAALRLHREDIKALLRKRYGSLAAFEEAKQLPAKAVSDFLRGRASASTEAAIAAEFIDPKLGSQPIPAGSANAQSDFSDDITLQQGAHSLSRTER